MEGVTLRNGLLRNVGYEGPKDVTPQFHALIRQSSRSSRWKNKKCAITSFFLFLLIVVIGVIIYIFVVKDIIFESENISDQNLSNTTTPSVTSHLDMSISSLSTGGNGNTKNKTISALTTPFVPVTTQHDLQCPTISAIKTQNDIIALFGGLNQNGLPSDTIELVPKTSCSVLPRYYCNKSQSKIFGIPLFSKYAFSNPNNTFRITFSSIDNRVFAQKGFQITKDTTSISHILPPGILITCLSTSTKFACFKYLTNLKAWTEINFSRSGKDRKKIIF